MSVDVVHVIRKTGGSCVVVVDAGDVVSNVVCWYTKMSRHSWLCRL